MSKYSRKKLPKFNIPTQVLFIKPEDFEDDIYALRWIGGIAYHNEIICLECGSVIGIEELFDNWLEIAEKGFDIPYPIDIYPQWVNLNENFS